MRVNIDTAEFEKRDRACAVAPSTCTLINIGGSGDSSKSYTSHNYDYDYSRQQQFSAADGGVSGETFGDVYNTDGGAFDLISKAIEEFTDFGAAAIGAGNKQAVNALSFAANTNTQANAFVADNTKAGEVRLAAKDKQTQQLAIAGAIAVGIGAIYFMRKRG